MPRAFSRWIGLLHFFRVMPPLPPLLAGCFACVAIVFTTAGLAGVAAPGAATVPVLFVQLFAAASGFATPARRGHFDLLLTRGDPRVLIAAVHWCASVAPGLAAWLVIAFVELAMRTRPVAATTGTAAAMLLVSTLPWAITVPLPRFSGAIGWLLTLVIAAAVPASAAAPGWLRFLVYPPDAVGADVLAAPLRVLPALAVAAAATVAALLWIQRMDVPLEAAQ
jgi:hypothetical protein